MPIGGLDLGFSYLGLVVLLVVALVLRRKWQLAVERSEEVKRLLVLAAEEAAEAEAESPYVGLPAAPISRRPLEYQCALCFSPTRTRCARCKAVRYCSGKCQILHWRRGHKEECRPFTSSNQLYDVRGGSSQKVLKQVEESIDTSTFEPEREQCAKSIGNFAEEPVCVKSNFPQTISRGNGNEVDQCADGKWTNTSSYGAKIPDQDQPNGISVNSNENHRTPRIDVWDSSSAAGESNGVHSNIKKPVGIAFQSEDMREDVASERSLPSEYVNQRQSADSLSDARHDSKVSLQSLSSERSNHVDIGTSITPRPLVSLSCDDSVAHLSAHSKEQSLQHRNTDFAPTVVARSSDIPSHSPNAGNGLKASPLKVVDPRKASNSQGHCQSGDGSDISGRYNYKGLFPYELFVRLYNWNKIELRPCGLTNCGNSCYANAVLQCLACTPSLTAYFLQGLHSKSCQRKEWCFTCEFELLILKAKEGASPLSPRRILFQIQNGGSHLGSGKEEDAHEFLRYAVDRMQSNCPNDARVDTTVSSEDETTLIGLTFGGYLLSKIKCSNCRDKSDSCEKMMDITVEIGGDIRTLEDALRQFTRTEILDGGNKYQCSRCRSYERAKKKLTILEAPNILTIALKRFQSGTFGKLNKSIRFPEILDLAPYMSGTDDKSPIYRLYGVVVHLDIMNAASSGHYVCYVKNVQNKWFKIDDNTVKAADLGCVLTKDAYMLFYARCSPRAPRLIRDPTVPRDRQRSASNLGSHPTRPWSVDPCHGQANTEFHHPNVTSLHHICTILEDDSLSDASSAMFSEGCSSSTESNRDSASADDYFDPFLGDVGLNWSSQCRRRNSSDSDSSSSSSCSSPYHLYSKHSPLRDSYRYSSKHPETSCCQTQNTKCRVADGLGFGHIPVSGRSEGKSTVTFSCSGSSEHCRNLVGRGNSSNSSCSVSRSSCRDADPYRSGVANKAVGNNNYVASFKQSINERTCQY